MNREIKFRAWDVVPYYDDEEEKREMICFSLEDTRIIENLSLKSIEMEYTGLKDQKGNEIYEGDILERKIYNCNDLILINRNVVVFDKGMFEQDWKIEWCRSKGWYKADNLKSYLNTYLGDFEIIGNIYQNPNLLLPNK